ncbi:MAG: Response regulator with CheY-like receiver domain and winged-helix DNA-binding domain [Blastococcus sp.]|nr:Response regulator with CheY-like receiver domain and winged-helix DNA-binding domain [Blastococcus sp.]
MDEAGHLLVDAATPVPAGRAAFRVLVADDEDDIRDLVCVAVAKAGGTLVAEVGDGAQALAAARSGLPDLAILDVNMPGATGLEVCTALRGDPTTAGIRILLLSAGATPDEVARGLAAGADAYLAKPFGIKALVQQVRALAEQTSPAGRPA